MQRIGNFLSGFLISAAAFGALGVAPAAALTQEEAAKKIAEEYGVEVLKTDAVLDNGKAVILLTVMESGGNSNSAFQVNTIAVDAGSGELIPGHRRLETGSVDSDEAPAAAIEERSPSAPPGQVPR